MGFDGRRASPILVEMVVHVDMQDQAASSLGEIDDPIEHPGWRAGGLLGWCSVGAK